MKKTLLLATWCAACLAQPTVKEAALWHHRNLGKAFYENPTTQKEAVEQFKQALALNPQSARERVNYGLALLKAGETKDAVSVLEAAQKQDPSVPHTWFNLSVVAKREGDYDRALQQMQGAEKLIPNEPTVHHNLGSIYKLLGKPEEAVKEFERAEQLNPNLAAPHFQLYNAYRTAGRAADASRELALFQEAKKRDTGAPIAENMESNDYTEIYDILNAPLPPVLLLKAYPAGYVATKPRTELQIDYDHDYDLDRMTFGLHSTLQRNNGDGTWTEQPFPFVNGNATDAKRFAIHPETAARDIIVTYADRHAMLYRDDLNGKFTAIPLDRVPPANALAVADWNRDGSLDVAVKTAKGYEFFRNVNGIFEPLAIPAGASEADSFALGEWARLAPNAPNEKSMRIEIIGIKNIKSAEGATVEVKAGALYQKKVYEGTPLFFSMRNYAQADTIRITWPNGLIQNEPQQPTGAKLLSYKEAQRLSGSCPMIFTWDGERFQFITDVLGVAPLGASSGDGQYFPVDHREHIRIPGRLLKPEQGEYKINITEELREVSYLDQVQLLAVDHPDASDIYTNDKFKAPPFPDFRLFGVVERVYPSRAMDDHGNDILPALLKSDRTYPKAFQHDAAGVAALHSIDLDFSGRAKEGRAVLYLTGWVDWADGSTFLGVSQRKAGGLAFPYLQVKDTQGQWKTVIEDMGIPAGKPKTIAIDLTGKFLSASREIRIVTNLCVYWDEIFLSENNDDPQVRTTALDPIDANVRYRGFSQPAIDPTREQPESFDYAQVNPLSNWNPTPGNYTPYGDVRELLNATDDKLLVMGSGDEVQLRFSAALPVLPQGWSRDFLLIVDGWAKDADANTAFGESVEPLPFHSMSAYPYRKDEHFPDDKAHQEYRRRYLTRPALQLIRPLARRATE